MNDPISFNKAQAIVRKDALIKSYQETLDHIKNREINKAIDLLEENGYTVIKNEQER